jgi:hypothetical protein
MSSMLKVTTAGAHLLDFVGQSATSIITLVITTTMRRITSKLSWYNTL